MTESCDVAIVGSGFAGSLLARVLTAQGRRVMLLERGSHPRFAIGESSTPLANLSLERLARRYGLADCYDVAAHGRWVRKHPELRRGLKRGFTFYRHHPDTPLDLSERLLVAASPEEEVSDSHWLRADFDHHMVRQSVAEGVDYRDCTELTAATFDGQGATLSGTRGGRAFGVRASFVVDASGPRGFLARQLDIPSALESTHTRSGLVFSHFTNVELMHDVAPLTQGPYVDDWAAVHHIVDEGWMYSLRFDHDVVSAGFALSPHGLVTLAPGRAPNPSLLWRTLVHRYPTLTRAFGNAEAILPINFQPQIQHRLASAAGERWLMLPHAFAFVDPLFSTGIAWSLRAIERIGLMFEASGARGVPDESDMLRYGALLSREADQIDALVAGAYESMAHFDLFAAHALIYFATVSYAETRQRIRQEEAAAWGGFLGVGDEVTDGIPSAALQRLHRITRGERATSTRAERGEYAAWVRDAIAPRNVIGLADPTRQNLYPVDLDLLIASHAKLGVTHAEMIDALPRLRGS